jgi:tetratricopeptide (TPR) repeat protein/transglutaminase-like putative cysteine protease
MARLFLILFFCLECTLQVGSQTKAPTSSDTAKEAAVVERFVTRLHYENDGTGFEEVTRAVRVQSDAGVEAYGQLVFGYSSATEKLEVNYVRVRKPNGEVVETPPSNAQDLAPQVLQSAPMYSDYRQRHVTVAGLRPGDLLEYRTTTRMHTPLAPGEFWYEYSFPQHLAVTEARLEVDIPKTRDLKLKSPARKYTTADSGERRIYTWVVQNIVPKRPKDDNESGPPPEEENEGPEIQLSTFKDWQQVARWYAKLQAERVAVDDTIRKKAIELTRGATTPTEKAHRLYDFVARDIRYVSLSFGVGRYQPHAASEVMQGSYGDCKDKHTLLAALLRAAGIESYPVLIGSDHKLDEDVPSPAQFDHVITAARLGNDLVWLDATAEVAPFGLILYQLRDKQALLVADDATAGLHKTTAVSPFKSSLSIAIDGKFSETGAFDASIDLVATGDTAVPLRMAFRSTSQADWQKLTEILSWTQGLRGKVSDLDVTPFDDSSKPFRLRYKYHDDSYFTVPSSGADFNPFPPLGVFRIPKARKNEPIDIGPNHEVHQRAHLQFPPNYTLTVPPEVRMSRDYGEYSSAFHLKDNVLDVERTLTIKVNKLPDARRTDLESMRSVVLGSAAQTLSCTIRPASKAALAAASPADSALPGDLRKAGIKALQERDYKTASSLLKRAVEKEPASPEAWDELGKAYLGLNKHSDALSAFQKQVEVNAYHKHAYNDLAAELQRQGKYEEAVAAYGKQLENSPVDNTARKNRGLLFLQLKQDKEALADLETSVATPPGDPRVQLALAQLYAGAGNTQKSRELLMSVVGAAPVPNADPYTAALRDDIDSEKTLDDAGKVLSDLGEQFDAGVFDEDSPEVFSAMHFVALEWARLGWAKFRKGETLEGMRYLDSAWTLSGSGTVANRLARVYQKALQPEKAKHLLTLAIAAGGEEVADSRSRLLKLGASNAPPAPAQGEAELLRIRTVKISGLTGKKGEAEFTLVFDGSSKPERVEYRQGDADLLDAEQALTNATYPVMFPDRSSVKIVRRGTLSCTASGCAVVLKPLEMVQPSPFKNIADKN